MTKKIDEGDVTEVRAYRVRASGWRVEFSGMDVVAANAPTLAEALRAAAARLDGGGSTRFVPTATQTGVRVVLSTKEVADRLGISIRGVQDLLNAGHIKGLRIGKLHRVEESEVERFIERLRAGEITTRGR